MAGMVSSAVVHESVGQILSGMVHRYEEKKESNVNRNLERLEMAHIRLEAALETSGKWQITDGSLLRWHRKLKRAAQECDDTLHKCKQRILEEEQMEQEVRNSSLPHRIAHATKSFIFSAFSHDKTELSGSIVGRFEWFADGASEFLRLLELGGTPWRHMPFGSFSKHLFAGKALRHKIVLGNNCPLFLLCVLPFKTAEHGIEATLIFIQKNGSAPEGNFYFSMLLQVSESTDIVGTAINCLQLFAPHVKCTVENMRKELTQLPTQDLPWVPYVDSSWKERWDNIHSLGSKWFRPSPLCCKRQDWHELRRTSNLDMAGLTDGLLEPVMLVNLQCQVSMSVYNKQKTSLSEEIISLQDSPYLKAGIIFAPHGSSEDMLPVNGSSAVAAIVGKEQHCLHTDIGLEQLEEIMLPEAIDYFHKNAEAAVYRMMWKSKHGFALIQVEKASMSTKRTSTRTQRSFEGARKRKLFQRQDQVLGNRTRMVSHLLDIWGAHVPVRLQNLLLEWMKKEKRSQLAAH